MINRAAKVKLGKGKVGGIFGWNDDVFPYKFVLSYHLFLKFLVLLSKTLSELFFIHVLAYFHLYNGY